ncbi:MAG: sensor histidine kinase [Gemmiger sp.]
MRMPHIAMPRPKYWQKIYLATLALFVVCLVGGMLGVTEISHRISFEARCDEFLNRQQLLVQSLAEDISAVNTRRPAALNDLFEQYARRYSGDGIRLAVWRDGECLYSNQEADQGEEDLALLSPGKLVWRVHLVNGRHVIYAATMLSGELEGYTVSCCADLEAFYDEWKRVTALVACLVTAAGALFAAGLLAVLKRMNRPLQDMTETARALAEGDFSVRTGSAARADDLGELGRTLNELAAQVERQMGELAAEAEAKQQLVDNLSHEMRTPLTAIGGYAEYIQRADLDKHELMEATETIRFESRRLLNLSNQLVKLSVLAHETPEFSLLSPNALLKRVVYAVTPKGRRRDVCVKAHLIAPESAQPPLWGDEDLLESLLVNLADNGVKACEKGGLVELRVYRGADGGCVFTVRDTGRGMDAGTLERIGRPFYRADKARSRAEGGAGLGVALCTAIAQAHGATLQYQSEPGRGTLVTAAFPPGAPPAATEEPDETT